MDGTEEALFGRKPRRIFLVLGIGLACGLAILLFVGLTTKASRSFPIVGSPAPDFSLPTGIDLKRVGTPASGGSHGRPMVLLFFGGWCSICHSELPTLATQIRAQQSRHGQLSQVVVVGVDSLDSPASAQSFARASGVTFPVGDDTTAYVTSAVYGFTGDPYSVFISGTGTVVAIHRGALSAGQLVSLERKLVSD